MVEIVLPDDEGWPEFDCCATHDIDDLRIIDPQRREVHWLGLRPRPHPPADRARDAQVAVGLTS